MSSFYKKPKSKSIKRYEPSEKVRALGLSPDSDSVSVSDSDSVSVSVSDSDDIKIRKSNAMINEEQKKKEAETKFFNYDLTEYLKEKKCVIAKDIYNKMATLEIVNSENIERVNNTIKKYMMMFDDNFPFSNNMKINNTKIYNCDIASSTGGKTRRRRVQRKQSRRRR
jgi:hypothetical protein